MTKYEQSLLHGISDALFTLSDVAFEWGKLHRAIFVRLEEIPELNTFEVSLFVDGQWENYVECMVVKEEAEAVVSMLSRKFNLEVRPSVTHLGLYNEGGVEHEPTQTANAQSGANQ